ncbi:hypothetical protein A0H81_03140 [Grifola frondosa]|uniref:Uncharacterized protein n=1 Tax=Grifola frondosa TaxID=5627 RepID=A0A1C7MHZ4_GRIFR|nr:hypothetical protein A0H81_03140 [Grifola frondosa]
MNDIRGSKLEVDPLIVPDVRVARPGNRVFSRSPLPLRVLRPVVDGELEPRARRRQNDLLVLPQLNVKLQSRTPVADNQAEADDFALSTSAFPLNLPEPVFGNGGRRPPSPLRNGYVLDPLTGELSDDGSIHASEESSNSKQWGRRSHSPSPSVAKFASNLAQRVGSLMSNMGPRSPGLPTDEELEADAERERERSRREAERILSREAEERRTVEERVMAMLQGTDGSPKSLPLPPSRSQTMPGTPPSPSSSQKDASWWAVAKSKLTPTKEPLTPAQQIIQETKVRDKEIEKEKRKLAKKQKSKEWPATANISSFLLLISDFSRARYTKYSPSLAASPLRSNDSNTNAPGSPSRSPPPLYAQFNAQGALDVPGTLLTIARRFEKLEKWTVGHVRALEDRMDDVERWLVEKERTREELAADSNPSHDAMNEMRDELSELQGRIGELGREMAKIVTAPGNLSSGPSRNSANIIRAPSATSSIAAQGSTSPTTITPIVSSRPSRTRLPYPTGDYATPPDTVLLSQGPFSPTNSPPASLTSASKRRVSTAGLPSQGMGNSSASNSPGLPRSDSPAESASFSALPRPHAPGLRPSSASPTPRKRYTVALGGPIMSAERDRERPSTPHSHSQSREMGTAIFSTSPISTTPTPYDADSADESDSASGVNEETIGRTAGRQAGLAPPTDTYESPSPSPNGGFRSKRSRPQSMYAPLASQSIATPAPVMPLNLRLRSHSTDRFGLGISDAAGAQIPVTPTSGRFVDPLVMRRQTKEALAGTAPPPPKVTGAKKVPVGELVAFFDQDKKDAGR